MFEERFQMVIQKDEEIKWCDRTNTIASVLTEVMTPAFLRRGFMCAVICICITAMLNSGGRSFTSGSIYKPLLFVLPVLLVLYVIYAFLNASNTYFCITNKRIIKRSGAFNNSFVHYTLKNVGTVQVNGGIADRDDSATLLITTKDFHTDRNGNKHANRLTIRALCNVYDAYNILSELVEGNNESLRVTLENN